MNEYTNVGGVAYTYDADGNLTSDGTNSYSYNSLNQLIGVTGPSGTTTYTYNALGQQVASTKNGLVTLSLVDPGGLGNIVGQFTASGAVIAHYSYGLGLTNQVAAGTSFFYDYDWLGSTSGLTNQQGQYINTYEYLPFGSILLEKRSRTQPFPI